MIVYNNMICSEKRSNLRACFLDANSGTTFNLDAARV